MQGLWRPLALTALVSVRWWLPCLCWLACGGAIRRLRLRL
nr:MAG TPA: hypothetical protein [Caudoviricetes sp.]